ncbi:MAG: hypothetical protein HZC54_17910 [Verrucomicrobia bacterium]|nr:hypothetical protein [Verrucomicrobiota bacterium]
MKSLAVIFIAIAVCGCTDRAATNSLSDASEQMTRQFVSQWDAQPHATSRKLKSVRITSFDTPTGNPRPYLGVALTWENGSRTHASLAMVQLGDGLFGVTYEDTTTKEKFSAIVSFR